MNYKNVVYVSIGANSNTLVLKSLKEIRDIYAMSL